MKNASSLLLGAGLFIAVFQFGTNRPASATTYTWTGNSDGAWNNPENWLDSVPIPPGSPTDVVIFPGPSGTNYCSLDFESYTLNSLQFYSSANSFSLAGPGNGFDEEFVFDGVSPTIVQDSSAHQSIHPYMVRLAANTTITGSGTGGVSFYCLTGPGDLIVEGQCLVSVVLFDDFTGGLVINSGTVKGDLFIIGGIPVTLGGGTLLCVDKLFASSTMVINANAGPIIASTAVTWLGDISGPGGLTKSGDGTLTLSGTNTYAGGTTFQEGTISIGADSRLGDSGGLTFDGGTLKTTAGIFSGRTVTVNSGGGTFDSNGFDSTLSGPIGGSGNLIKTGDGMLTLSAANTFSGELHISQGSVRMENNLALQNCTFDSCSPGTLNFGTVTELVLGGLSGSGNVDLGSLSLTVGTNTSTYSGTLSGTGSLTKIGTGTLELLGSNTYSGGTAINEGVLSVASDDNLGDLSADLTFGGGTLRTADGFSSGRTVILNVKGGQFDVLEGGSTFAGNVTGSGGLTKAGVGTLTLSGSNSYEGPTTVGCGTLRVGAANALPSGTAFVVTEDGELDLNGFDYTTPGISGTGKVSLGNGTLTVDNASATMLSVSISGSGGLTKSGSADLTLDGENTYTGLTIVNAGRLIITGQNKSMYFTTNSGAVLRLDGITLFDPSTRTLRAQSGGTVEYNGVTVNGGYLRGPGTHSTLAGSTNDFNGVSSFGSTDFQQGGATTFMNFTNGGRITNNGILTWDGGVNATSGRLIVNDTANVQDWANDGLVTINGGSVLNNSLSSLVSGGGSEITINLDGQLNVDSQGGGTTLDLRGSLLVNNGTITGTTNVYYGASAKGDGTFAQVNVFDGGTFSLGYGLHTLTVDGDLEMKDGSECACELASYADELVAVTGDVTLKTGSTLTLQAGSKLDTWGDTIQTIITAADIHGAFTNEPTVGDYLGYGIWFGDQSGTGVTYNGDTVGVHVFQALEGDTDGDRDVDFSDFGNLANYYTGSLDFGVGGKRVRVLSTHRARPASFPSPAR
jgi:autotransporter-associated beta strand protein